MNRTYRSTLGSLLFLWPLAPAPDNTCTGMGTTVGIELICSGTCEDGECQSQGDGLDSKGSFSFCGCAKDDYDNCCTVVLRDGVARPFGTCPPCGASGTCQLYDNPEGNLNEPACLPPPRVQGRSQPKR